MIPVISVLTLPKETPQPCEIPASLSCLYQWLPDLGFLGRVPQAERETLPCVIRVQLQVQGRALIHQEVKTVSGGEGYEVESLSCSLPQSHYFTLRPHKLSESL